MKQEAIMSSSNSTSPPQVSIRLQDSAASRPITLVDVFRRSMTPAEPRPRAERQLVHRHLADALNAVLTEALDLLEEEREAGSLTLQEALAFGQDTQQPQAKAPRQQAADL